MSSPGSPPVKRKASGGVSIGSSQDLIDYLAENPLTGDSVTVTYLHNGNERQAALTPVMSSYASLNFSYSLREDQSSLGILKYSVLEVKYWVEMVIDSLGMLFTGQYQLSDLSGPVGVVDIVNEVASQQEDFISALNEIIYFFALIAVNLAVMNLLPIPALDGGRIFMILVTWVIEKITRRKVNPKYEGWVHAAGFMLLIGIMILVAFNDIVRLFTGQGLGG